MKHTPTPWSYENLNGRHVVVAPRLTSSGKTINHVIVEADVNNGVPHDEAKSNAQFVARSCTNNAALIEALRIVSDGINTVFSGGLSKLAKEQHILALQEVAENAVRQAEAR